MTRTEILPQIFSLSEYDQILIAEAIRNHLSGNRAPVSEQEFREELQRRVEDADRNPHDQSPLGDVMRRLRAGL